jgi:hypothetical protein
VLLRKELNIFNVKEMNVKFAYRGTTRLIRSRVYTRLAERVITRLKSRINSMSVDNRSGDRKSVRFFIFCFFIEFLEESGRKLIIYI